MKPKKALNLKPWELVPGGLGFWKTSDDQTQNFLGVWVYDGFIEKIFLNQLAASDEDKKIHYFDYKDINNLWFEEKLHTLDFFRDAETYCILESEKLKPQVQKFILEELGDINPHRLIFLFRKDHIFLKQLEQKLKSIAIIRITAPAFWEYKKLLDYLARSLGVILPSFMSDFILESLNSDVGEYIQALKLIKLEQSSAGEFDWKEIQKLLTPNRLDQFKFAKLLSIKDRRNFYEQLLKLKVDFEDLGQLFGFLQGHLFKILDPSYVKNKAKLSQYDKDIEAYGRAWKSQEILQEMRHFAEMQILAKQRSSKLEMALRGELLKNYN